jgi:hypothetical protein
MTDINLIEGKALEALRNRVRVKQEKRRKTAEKARAKLESKPEYIIQHLKDELEQAKWEISTLERQVKSYRKDGRAILFILTGDEEYNGHQD